MSLAPALAILAVGLAGPWRAAAGAGAMLLAGVAAQKGMTDPFWFQHVRPRPDGPVAWAMLATVFLQGLVALTLLWTRGVFRRLVPAVLAFGAVRILAFGVLLVLFSASAMDQIARGDTGGYLRQLVYELGFLGLNLSTFAALLAALPVAGLKRLANWAGGVLTLPGQTGPATRLDRIIPYALALLVLVPALLIAFVVLEAVPHLDDVIYRFQARYLADGMISWPVPPVREAFDIYLMDQRGDQWFATPFPGWPAALAIGQILGIELLITPVMGALCVLLLHRVTAALIDRGTAHLAALLLATSPWHMMSAANPLIHTFSYTLILGAWVLLIAARDRPSVLRPFLAGLLMGWVFLARPLDGVMMGMLTGLWLLAYLAQDRGHIRTVISYGMGCLALAWMIFPYNAALTGDPLGTPANTYLDRLWGAGSNALGFGPNRGAVPDWGTIDALDGHSPLEALINAHQNIHEIASSLFGWGGASLVFVFVYLLWGRWTALTRAMGLICVAVFGLYSLYWFYGGFYIGARYWFLTLVPLVILTAFGIRTAAAKLSALAPDSAMGARLGVGVMAFCLCGLVVFESWVAVNRYPGINGYHADYLELARDERFENALVFIENHSDREYGSAFWLNDFGADARTPLFARYLGPESAREIAAAWPDRPIFMVRGRGDDTDNVTVLHGPLTIPELSREGF